ncbi:metal-dependent hydrolase [Clostridium sp. YIM B02515]|uniref:Metal-dependent hydrolase n=1 Tax=Clostridium rhizosphaerae TaxID=2803861 RepID=A0ABS1TAJ7_9CLOT|nr:metal-dependent hydrolase [Clostridium rhizosphaerae]MBL4936296.1 metal-dependent hydrolase [Clostridium rhizosphaerae]
MKGTTHAGIGLAVYTAVSDRLPGGFNYIGMAVVLGASLLPDIDHPKSLINRYILPFKNKGAKVTLYLCGGIIVLWFDYLYTNQPAYKALGAALIAVGLSSHRQGLTHSLLGMITFSFIIGYIGNKYNIKNITSCFILGYSLHLLGDMATNRGVPLFYPFKNKKMRLPLTYRVGSKLGNFIELVLVVSGLLYVIYRIPIITS